MMSESGFKIGEDVSVVVDPQLPFMGYTVPLVSGGFRIVVSGGAVGTEMFSGLLIHEMSHIYRIENEHSSHDGELLEEAINNVSKSLRHEYQQKIIQDLLNDIQDLYADDIAFQVLRKNPTIPWDQLTSFLQSLVKDSLVKTIDRRRDRWVNSSTMLHNARAIAQMRRHHVEDVGEAATKSNKEFLVQLPPDMAREFDFFRDRLENLKENITREEYRRLLSEYLSKFLSIAEKN